MAGAIRAEKDGAIGWLVLDNPARLNALDSAMWRAIPPAVAQFDTDPEVRVIVLRGEGEKAFAVGMDISEFETARTTPEKVAAFDRLIDEASVQIAERMQIVERRRRAKTPDYLWLRPTG